MINHNINKMESWNVKTKKFIPTPEKQIKFVEEIESICKKYELSISHEDSQGSFIIDKFNQYNIKWLQSASIKWL